tara:strand:+ start:4585 stop:5934 length:1350 start_codon:yes stop_codon:yes gene_type:complete
MSTSPTVKKRSGALLDQSDLTKQQTEAVWRLYEDNCLAMLPVGFGKTVVSQTAAQELLDEGHVLRVLVVAPLRVCQQTWAKEWLQWSHLEEVGMAIGKPSDRVAAIDSDARIVVTSYDLLPWLMDHYSDQFDGLILDELTKLKGGGKQFRALRHKIKRFQWRVGMTGTFAEEGLEGLFYQVMCVDDGAALGRRKDAYLNKYFTSDWNGYNWTPRDGASERIARVLGDLVHKVERVAEHVPRVEVEVRTVPLSNDARVLYDGLKRDMLLSDEGVTAANMAVLSGKLEQLANGFYYDDDGATHLVGGGKLVQVCDAVDAPGPLVIAYRFKAQLALLRRWCPDGLELRDAGALEAWDAGELPVLFLHPKSAGHGLNLQKTSCDRLLWLGPDWSRDATDQVAGRLARRGNTAEVVRVTVLVGENTVEDKLMLPRLEGKAAGAQEFRDHLAGKG